MIDELLKDFELYHSDFQIDNFIIGGQGTDWFQYKQCLREIKSRVESLDSATEQMALFEIGRKSIRGKIKLFFMGSIRRKIFLNSETRQAAAMAQNIRDTRRELDRFVGLAKKLRARIGEIDSDRRQALESEGWYQKALHMAAVEIYTAGGPSKQTVEFILSLPMEYRKSILTNLKSVKPERILEIEDKENEKSSYNFSSNYILRHSG